MKKTLFFVAVATLFALSCQKEVDPAQQEKSGNSLAFKASIEQLVDADTKATINGSNQLVWAESDKIGVYFPTWGETHQAFTLSSGAGTTQGTFTRDQSGEYSPTDASVAFFPWQGTGSDKNNVYDGTMYFKLGNDIWGYDNGDMITPLVASISSSAAISFKHVGAAVKLTVNNLVSGTYAVKMTAYNKQISGDFHVNPANAGTDPMVLDAAENTSLNHITLHSWKSSGAFSWIFPVPAPFDDPKLKFEITDDNDIIVWKKSLAAQADKDLARGDILVMPALSISPYQQFTLNTSWSVCGDHNSWGDTKMVSDGTLFIAKSVTFAANQQFKIRTYGDTSWSEPNYGYDQLNGKDGNGTTGKDKWHVNAVAGTENNNIKITTAGTYDIIFNSSSSDYCGYKAHEIRVVQNGFPYPLPKETASITINGTFTDWDGVTSESAGNTTVKVVSDNNKVYIYVKITGAASDIWDNGGDKYVYALFDLDGDPSNDVDQWGNKGDFVLLLYPYAAGPAIVTSSASSATAWICKPNTPYTVSNISLAGAFTEADGSGNRDITYEFSIPRADMPSIPSTDPITITIKGSKISSSPSISRLL